MPKSEIAKNLDALQTHVTAFLKPLGFRRKGRTYNRIAEGGLVQVVHFQMGDYPVGEHYIVPGIRESFYGKFAVNLGILLPCVYEAEWQRPVPEFAQEYDCTIRDRLGALAFGADHWFDLTTDVSTLVQLLDRFGLPFFAQFPDYQSVLAHYEAHGNLPVQNSQRSTLEAAIIANHLGDAHRSQRLFAEARAVDHKGFRDHVLAIANRLGHRVR